MKRNTGKKSTPREDEYSPPDSIEDTFSPVELKKSVATRIISTCTEVIQTKGMAGRIKQLEAVADEVGVRRSEFNEAIKALGDDEPAVTMGWLGVTVSINKNGDPIFDDQQKLAKFPSGVHMTAKAALPGSAPGNKRIGDMLVPCGGIGIAASGGLGKTPLAHALASNGKSSYSVVRVGEPLAGYASSSLSKETIAYSLALAVLNSSDVVLDSIKDLLASSGGLMKSGISREALVSICDWSSAACDAGCSIYIPINPSTKDEEVQEMMIEIGKSNSTSLIAPANLKTWNYFNRRGEGLLRTTGQFEMEFGSNGLAAVSSINQSKTISDDDFTKVVATVLSREAVSFAARRALQTSTSAE